MLGGHTGATPIQKLACFQGRFSSMPPPFSIQNPSNLEDTKCKCKFDCLPVGRLDGRLLEYVAHVTGYTTSRLGAVSESFLGSKVYEKPCSRPNSAILTPGTCF